MKNTKGIPKTMKGWELRFYGERNYRMYIKGGYVIRQMHFSGGSIRPNSWEILTGNKVVAFARSREEARIIAESMMR